MSDNKSIATKSCVNEAYLILNENRYIFAIKLQDIKKIIDCENLDIYQIPGEKTRWMTKAEGQVIQIGSINFLERCPEKSDKLIILDLDSQEKHIGFVVEKVYDIEQCAPSDLVVRIKSGLANVLTKDSIV